MNFDLWFPTAILSDNVENYQEINEKLLKKISEIRNSHPSGGPNWLGKPYNTCGTYNIVQDPDFAEIIKEITLRVKHYATRLGINLSRYQPSCEEGWLNIYNQNDFQEYHYHAGFQFSAVYYVSTSENSSEIIFESPNPPNMNPLPIILHGPLTDERIRYTAEAGKVIIFKSNLKHCVPPQQGTGERISLAFNFK